MEEKFMCHGCLSLDRNLQPLGQYLELYTTLLGHDEIKDVKYSKVGMCWECFAKLRQISQFRRQIRSTQEFLLASILHCSYLSVKSLSKLSFKHKNDYDLILHHSDNGISDTNGTLIEQILTESKNTNTININLNELTENTSNEKVLSEIEINIKSEENESPSEEFYEDTSLFDDVSKDSFESEDDIKVKNVNRQVKRDSKTYNYKDEMIVTKTDVDLAEFKKYFVKYKLSESEIEKLNEEKRNDPYYQLSQFKCDLCLLGFAKFSLLKMHNKDKHMKFKKPFKCVQCASRFETSFDCDNHAVLNHPVCKCTLCPQLLINRLQMRLHLKMMHAFNFTCVRCRQQFCSQRRFDDHFLLSHVRLTCDHCGKTFQSKKRIQNHIRREHFPHECKACNKTFKHFTGLRKHEDMCHPQTNIKDLELAYCVECDKQYDNIFRYRRHITNSTKHCKVIKRNPATCPECGKMFSRKTYMNNHFKLFHVKKNKNYCELCDKYFVSGYSLRNHKKHVHDKVVKAKTKMCNVCGRSFSTNRILTNHIRTHTGERPYHCPRCTAAFSQKTAMMTHLRARHKNEQ